MEITSKEIINVYLNELKQVATHDNHPEIIEFDIAVHIHAPTEEEIFFFPRAMAEY